MVEARLTTALCTPLTDDERLDEPALCAHIQDQIAHGIHGGLLAGSMGQMQMLSDDAYRRLVEVGVEQMRGRMEVFVGAGDTSLARTRDRVLTLNDIEGIDGVAILAPFFSPFSQAELIRYFGALADVSRAPLLLYDIPQRTRTKIEIPTMLELAKHPNIAGAKCSDEFGATRELMVAVSERYPDFRLLIAQPPLLDMLVRQGVRDHLDGMWAIAPQWSMRVLDSVAANDDASARLYTDKLTLLRYVLRQYAFMPAVTAVLNARGVPGRYYAAAEIALDEGEQTSLLNHPVVKELLATDTAGLPV